MPRIFQSFTEKLTILALLLAALTAIALYDKEVASVVQAYTNMHMSYTPTENEVAHFRKAALWYFFVFSLPLIPLFIYKDKKPAQVMIIITSSLVLLLAVTISPGGDQKGCEECLAPIFLSIASTIFIILLAPLWAVAALIFRLMTGRNPNVPKKPE